MIRKTTAILGHTENWNGKPFNSSSANAVKLFGSDHRSTMEKAVHQITNAAGRSNHPGPAHRNVPVVFCELRRKAVGHEDTSCASAICTPS
jgi:hypothetical protein